MAFFLETALYTFTCRKNLYLPKFERIYELPQLGVKISKPQLLVVMAIISSWKQKTPKPADIQNNSLLDDVFSNKGRLLALSDLEVESDPQLNH